MIVRKPLIILSVLTLLYGGYYWGIPAAVNIKHNISYVERKVLNDAGVRIKITDPKIKMGLTPAIWLMAENTSILNGDNTSALSLDHTAVKINILPLIFGKIHIGNFSADSINANFIYTKEGELKLGEYTLPQVQNTGFKLNKAYMRIGNYKINIKDYKQNKNVTLDGEYLVNEFKNNKRIKLATNAILYVNKKSSEIMADIDVKLPLNKISKDQFKVNGRISNLDLGDFSEYAKALPESKIDSLSGHVDIIAGTDEKENNDKSIFAQISLNKPHIMYKDKDRSIYCNDNLELKAHLETIKNGLNLSDVKIKSKGIDVSVNGKVTKLNASMPHVDMNIKIGNSRTEKFIPLMPGEEDLLPDVNLLTLKRNPFYGDINGELNVKGKADTANVDGKIVVKNGYLNAPLPHNTPLADIVLEFAGTDMYMDVKVPAPINQMVYVKGTTGLYNRYADLDITSTENVDLKTAQIVLNPLHEILKFELGPVPIMDIRGIGNIKLKVKGTKEEPHTWGQFNFRNTTASFLDIHNMTLVNGEGSLDFDDELAHFYTKQATMYGKPVVIDGTCSLYGDMKFDVEAKDQDLANLLNIIKSSPMLADIQNLISPINSGHGKTDLILQLNGKVPDVKNIVFNKNIFAKGFIKLYSATVNLMGMNVSNISGDINFENLNTDFNLTSDLENSNLKMSGKMDDKNIDVNVLSDKFVLKDGLKFINYKLPEDLGKITTSFEASYKGAIEKINSAGLNVSGKIYAFKGQNLSLENSYFGIKNGDLKMSPIKGFYKSSPYYIKLSAENILSNKQSLNGDFNIQNFDLKYLKGLPVKNLSGTVNLKGQIKNNGIYSDINLNDISFAYNPLKIKINTGKAQIRKDTVILNKINAYAEDTPVFIDGKINKIFTKNPELNLNFGSRLTQNFADAAYNNNSVYPLKIKGDVRLSSAITGTINAIHNKTRLHIGKDSGVYYMGSTIGSLSSDNDIPTSSVDILIDNILYNNGIKINILEYNNITPEKRVQPQLNASGYIEFLKNNDLRFNNFKIKTQKPTDAKIFNIVFRKPLIKDDVFTSDLLINGKASAPYLLGKFHITDINMPVFDANINDINLDFRKDKIYLNSKGNILTSAVTTSAILKNKLTAPLVFEDININLETININKITDFLRDYDVNSTRTYTIASSQVPDFGGIIIKKSKITADNIKIKELNAKDFTAYVTLNDKMQLDVPSYKFNIAGGISTGSIKYNLLNHIVNISAKVKDANAQTITETLTDLKGQVFGNVAGEINVYCNGKSHDACIQTLCGNGSFEITNGRMPKLGSLEYLLKAGNLIKSGFTGLSIKGIVDLITPYKTGQFDSIKGSYELTNGIANNLKIYSSGKALNIFVNGSYNLNNQISDMRIFGALTNSFSSIIGKIGSASLNTLFNTIPWVNISDIPKDQSDDIKQIPNGENAIRMFNAIIYGDINGNDYVKSFKWLK